MATRIKNSGVSLLELMIAMAIFAIFAVSFMSGVGQNIFSSNRNKEEVKMLELAQMKINELIISPPPLKETLLESAPDEKEIEGFPDFKYSVLLKKFFVPDYNKIFPPTSEEDSSGPIDAIQKRAFKMVKDNMERLIWQISVTITNTKNGNKYTLSTWLYNHDGNVFMAEGF